MSQIPSRPPTGADSNFYKLQDGDLGRLLENAYRRGTITDLDYQLIIDYVTELLAVKGIKPNRALKTASLAINWRYHIGPYTDNTLSEIYTGISRLRATGKKQNTVRDYIGFLRRFYLWLIEAGYSHIPMEKISQIRPPAVDTMTVTAGDLLTEEEVMTLIRACQSSRDRALISVLYEGGFRISELGTLTWGQVSFDEHGTVINVNVKTEKPRHIRLVAATQFLAAWKRDYPFEPVDNTLVFITAQKKAPSYAQMAAQIKKIGKRAGLAKRVNPHIFRHSRATHLLRAGVHESVVKQMLWGHQGTKMLETYGHLTSRDIDDALLSLHGIRREYRPTGPGMRARQCKACECINDPTATFCVICGQPLTRETEQTMEQVTREIEKHPLYAEIKAEITRRLVEIH